MSNGSARVPWSCVAIQGNLKTRQMKLITYVSKNEGSAEGVGSFSGKSDTRQEKRTLTPNGHSGTRAVVVDGCFAASFLRPPLTSTHNKRTSQTKRQRVFGERWSSSSWRGAPRISKSCYQTTHNTVTPTKRRESLPLSSRRQQYTFSVVVVRDFDEEVATLASAT